MKKAFICIIFIIVAFGVTAQDDQIVLDTFLRNFQRADQIETKLKVLEDAANYGSTNMGPLFHEAINFVLNNPDLIHTDTLITQISFLAVEEIKNLGYVDSKYALWQLFTEDASTTLRISILEALSIIGKNDERILENCINWLNLQITLFFSGSRPDHQVVSYMIRALGEFKSSLAFPCLFSSKVLGYSAEITILAENAVYQLEGSMKEMLMGVIENGTISEKREALKMGLDLDNDRLNNTEKAELAEFTLEIAIYASTGDQAEKTLIRNMRFESVNALRNAKWSKATSLIIEHFGMTLLEYDRGIIAKSRLLEAIDALGNMSTHEAAERLTLYLELVNSYTEHGKVFDEQITLTVVNNLNILGDKIAYADLSNIKYLNYSSTIKQAAQNAADNLVW